MFNAETDVGVPVISQVVVLSAKPVGSAGETEQLVIAEPPVHDIEIGVIAVLTVYNVEAATIAHEAGTAVDPITIEIIAVRSE